MFFHPLLILLSSVALRSDVVSCQRCPARLQLGWFSCQRSETVAAPLVSKRQPGQRVCSSVRRIVDTGLASCNAFSSLPSLVGLVSRARRDPMCLWRQKALCFV
ncbi:hypothetical protein F4678DRAFT_190116 [Xylaria arbuscula]|nr:hypothetical protein F4678DRAFT_190116 [Xylaria arbuscula]